MTEPNYSVKEIIEMQFKTLREDLKEIKETLKAQDMRTELRFTKVEKEIEDVKIEVARYKVVWGIGATVGASVIAYLLNKFTF